jgi:hypothetical protein
MLFFKTTVQSQYGAEMLRNKNQTHPPPPTPPPPPTNPHHTHQWYLITSGCDVFSVFRFARYTFRFQSHYIHLLCPQLTLLQWRKIPWSVVEKMRENVRGLWPGILSSFCANTSNRLHSYTLYTNSFIQMRIA